jgi:hypothetical protein
MRRNFMRRHVLFGWWWAAALSGCTPLGLWLYQDPAFEVSEIKLSREQPTDSTVLVALYVWNPNNYELMTARFELELEVDGRTVGHYARDSIIPVPQVATATMHLPFLPPDRGRRLERLPAGTHRVEVEGEAFFMTPFGERGVRVAHSGDVAVDPAEAFGDTQSVRRARRY